MAGELTDERVAQVTELCERGDDAVERGALDEALGFYDQALALVPAPIYQWRIATWILTAVGDACFLKKDYARARRALHRALRCPGGSDNPFVHLRLGQIELELGSPNAARDELHRAYRKAGQSIFGDEDPKYWDLIKRSVEDDGSEPDA
jgi:tetratricopeptide (TPR) repeat protein